MKAKGYLGFAIAIAMMSESALHGHDEILKKHEPPKEPRKIIPKGCKEFHFTKSGTQVTENCTYIYFSCVASNQKIAIKKFNNFIKEKTRT